jgi:phenylalanyl-tRNA synthetase beta chain
MKFSQNLLRQFVSYNHGPEQLAELLTERAFEVEEVIAIKPAFRGIITAQVSSIEAHPNADKLRVVTLSDGNKSIGPVVCGAHNFVVGDIVALAQPGAHIAQNIHSETHEPFELETATIRGVTSQGMLCAQFELGLVDKPDDGIWVLPADTAVGVSLDTLIPEDVVFDVSLPANRPDLFSHWGLAREIAFVLDLPFTDEHISSLTVNATAPQSSNELAIDPESAADSSYKAGLTVTVKPSPLWLQNVLRSVGHRAINNVVDITNYVMIEVGQPTHAFDGDLIGNMLSIRRAVAGESVTALNHKAYILDNTMTVLANDQGVLDIAGIMGGADSEVSNQTTNIVLTATHFNAGQIRTTSRALGLRSDASSLFEKGLAPELTTYATSRVIDLLNKHADGQAQYVYHASHRQATPPTVVNTDVTSINNLIGSDLSLETITSYTNRIGQSAAQGESITVTIPWWRSDLASSADITEEVIKLHGLNNITPTPPAIVANEAVKTTPLWQFGRISKAFLAQHGYSEVQNYSFIAEQDITNFYDAPEQHVAITNPLSAEQSHLKQTLLIPLLKNMAQSQGTLEHDQTLRLFELGKHYFGYGEEPWFLTCASYSPSLHPQVLAQELKGLTEQYLSHLGLSDITFVTSDDSTTIQSKGTAIGRAGLVASRTTKKFGLDSAMVYVELSVKDLLPLCSNVTVAMPSRYPSVSRDISVVVPTATTWEQLTAPLKTLSPLITTINLFTADFLASGEETAFHQELASQGQKNWGIRLTFQAPDRTLTDSEITGLMEQILLQLKEQAGAIIR